MNLQKGGTNGVNGARPSGNETLWVTPLGVDQFLEGRLVVDPDDRSKLARLMVMAQVVPFAPTPQAALGADQLLNGQIVIEPSDRSKLASLMVQGFAAAAPRTKGSGLLFDTM